MGISPASALDKCSSLYGHNSTQACIRVLSGQTYAITNSVYGAYNVYAIDKMCDGTGNNCGTISATSDTTGFCVAHISTTAKSVVSGHTYYAIGTWNDCYDGAPFQGIPSPLIAWNAG
jgi:hypothetical protein